MNIKFLISLIKIIIKFILLIFILKNIYFIEINFKIAVIYLIKIYKYDFFDVKNNILIILYIIIIINLFLKIKNKKLVIYILLCIYFLIKIIINLIKYNFNYNLLFSFDLNLLKFFKNKLIKNLIIIHFLTYIYVELHKLTYKNIFVKYFHFFFIFTNFLIIFNGLDLYINFIYYIVKAWLLYILKIYFLKFFKPICKLCYISGLFLLLIVFDMFNEKKTIKKHIIIISILIIYIFIKCFILYDKYAKKKKMSNPLMLIQILFISIFPLLLFIFSNLYTFFFSNNGLNINSREFYECGFKTISDNQVVLDIHYITVGLIFLIYEMEVILFVPIFINYIAYSYIYIFILIYSVFIISVSYIYEWDNYGFNITFN